MPNLTAKPGFTLTELLIVIALIGLLAVLVFVALSGVKVTARNSRAMSEITQIGVSVETFKNSNGDRPLIVQQPYAPVNPSLVLVTCYATVPAAACFPTNAIGPTGSNGFTNYLFNGTESSNFNNVRIDTTAGSSYEYSYMTQDCSSDTVASSGGYHKVSQFPDYIITAGLNPAADGSSSDNFWVKDGVSGRGPDTAVPLMPFFNPGSISIPGITGTQSNCQSNYP